MSDTESSARTSDDSDQEVEEEEVEEEEDVDEEESEEGEEEEVEEEEVEDEEDIEDENDDIDTNDENDENDESDDSDHNTIKSDTESDSEKISTESESDDDSGGDEKKIGKKTVKTKMKTQPVEDKLMKKEILALKHKSDSDEDSNTDDNSESDKQQSVKKEKGLVGKIENKESIKETEIKVQPVDSVREESPELQQKSDSDDKQGSEGELKGLAHKIETEDSQKETKIHLQHDEDKSVKIDSLELKRKRDADDDSQSDFKRDEQKSNGTVKDLAAKTGNKESKHGESVKEESLALQQISHLATDSHGNDNSKSDQQESGRKVIGYAAKIENKESEKETEIKLQPVKSVRKESPELQQKNHSAKVSKGNDTFKSDKQEMKDIAAKTEIKDIKNQTKIIAAQPVEDKSLKKDLSELRRHNDSSDSYKSNKQVMEVKVPAAKTEINERKKETKINTQPIEAESVRKQSSDQANKALPTEKKEAKKEDFSQTTGVPGTYIQVNRSDVISTRRVGTQTKLKHYNVCTFTSGLIKKVNMQTYTSGLISKSDHSTNTIQERGKDKKTQTKDKYVLERHLTVKDNDSSEKKTADNKDTTKQSGENEDETSVQLKRRKVKVPLLKLSPEEESNSANSTESTEDRPPQPDSLSKKAKDITSIQKLQKTPMESSGVYTDKEYDKKTRKEKENIRRRGRRRPQLCNFSKRHPSREYIPQPSKNKTSHFRRPTSAGPVYKRELINPIHRPGDSKNKILLVRPNSAGPVHKRQSKQPEGTALSMAQYRMLYHHRWADISC